MKLLDHLKESIEYAEHDLSALSPYGEPVASLGGMHGRKTLHLLNNLGRMDRLSYLEVGVYQGATLMATAYGNSCRAFGIDDFSQFNETGENERRVRQAMALWSGEANVQLVVGDCWQIPLAELPPTDVLFYDGAHDQASTARAFTHFLPALQNQFILLIDDYDWAEVRMGVSQGLREIPAKWLYDCQLGRGKAEDESGWWNGLLCLMFEKQP